MVKTRTARSEPDPAPGSNLPIDVNRSTLGQTWHLAWPLILENTLATSFGFVDTIMVGSLGAAAISAIALNSSVIYLFNGLLTTFSIGSMVLVAQSVGARRLDKAAAISRQTLVLGVLAGLAALLFLWGISGQLPTWMGGLPEVRPQATVYLRWVILSYPLFYAGQVMAAILRGLGDTRTPLRLTLAGNLTNVAGNFLLIFPARSLVLGSWHLAIPGAGLGVVGAAMATALSQSLTGLALILVFVLKEFPLRFRCQQSFRIVGPDLRQILRIGVPAALDRSSHTVGLLIYVRIVASLGTVALAAHQLATTAESMTYMPAIGFATAATTLVGQAVGARRPERAIAYSRTALAVGTVVMTVLAGLLFAFPGLVMRLFTSDPAVISLGIATLRAYVWCLPLFAIALTAAGSMRGAGDTRVPFYYAAAGMWGLRLPLAILAVSWLGLGLPAVWVAMGIDLSFRGVVMGVRLFRNRWLPKTSLRETADSPSR